MRVSVGVGTLPQIRAAEKYIVFYRHRINLSYKYIAKHCDITLRMLVIISFHFYLTNNVLYVSINTLMYCLFITNYIIDVIIAIINNVIAYFPHIVQPYHRVSA